MKPKKETRERRKHPRYYPDEENQPQVSFIFDDGEKISVEVVNISRSGIFGSTTSIEHFIDADNQKINIIEIFPPNNKPFRCAGKLLRVHPLSEDNKCFIAVEFCKIGEEESLPLENNENLELKSPEKKELMSDDELLSRVEQAENYMKIMDTEQASKIRKIVYDSFNDITYNLSLEDKWTFFELLDEMQSRQPNYPEELKQDFIKLCRIGLEGYPEEPKEVKLRLVDKYSG